ncbi:MAG: extracellular solute-binding protein [Rhodospirillales bacterium]|nr:extracellular solute-binding protein [Rhodospirillales bacterium]
MRRLLGLLAAALIVATAIAGAGTARAGGFNWQRYKGHTIHFLNENNPWANELRPFLPEFTKLTGIKVEVLTFEEQQMRQRLVTILQSHDAGVDEFMSLSSLEGPLFDKAGWYADLGPVMRAPGGTAPGYDLKDFSAPLLKAVTFGGKLESIPVNIEGPVIYYRKDIFARCHVAVPKTLAEVTAAAAAIHKCDPAITPWVTRGLAPALPYTFSNTLHNFGTDYFSAPRKPALCTPKAEAAIAWYASMLHDYGPPGAVNYSFVQIADLYGAGRAAMAFESSNELGPIMKFPGRAKDTGLILLPPGPGGAQKPTVIGWGLAMSAFSAAKPETWYFMQWATSKAMQTTLALHGIAPPRGSVAASAAYHAWLAKEPVRQVWAALIDRMAANGTSEVGPPVRRQAQARQIVGEAIDKVMLGQATAKQAACAADRELTTMLATP